MYEDLDRPPLRPLALAKALSADGWRVEVVPSAASTNALVAARAVAGEPAGLVVVAEQQTAGRGRMDRTWLSPPRAGLTFSALLRPDLPADRWPWLPLWGGLAVARALRETAGVDAVLKWPNDVLVRGRKLCGLLAEVAAPGAVVLGVGLNVTSLADELPPEGATSLRLEDAVVTDRDTLLRAVLRSLNAVLTERPEASYRALCATLDSQVQVQLPGGEVVEGLATAVDARGRLVVDGVTYTAGDVVHLR